MRYFTLAAILALLGALLIGCGGGGAARSGRKTGRITLTVMLPKRPISNRVVPLNSTTLTISNYNTVDANGNVSAVTYSYTITSTDRTNGFATINTLPPVLAGVSYTINITANDPNDPNDPNNKLASGSVPVSLTPGATQNLTVTLTSAVVSLIISTNQPPTAPPVPATPSSLASGQLLTLYAFTADKSGNYLYAANATGPTINWVTSANFIVLSTSVVQNNPGYSSITVLEKQPGQGNITATYVEQTVTGSQTIAANSVNITLLPPGLGAPTSTPINDVTNTNVPAANLFDVVGESAPAGDVLFKDTNKSIAGSAGVTRIVPYPTSVTGESDFDPTYSGALSRLTYLSTTNYWAVIKANQFQVMAFPRNSLKGDLSGAAWPYTPPVAGTKILDLDAPGTQPLFLLEQVGANYQIEIVQYTATTATSFKTVAVPSGFTPTNLAVYVASAGEIDLFLTGSNAGGGHVAKLILDGSYNLTTSNLNFTSYAPTAIDIAVSDNSNIPYVYLLDLASNQIDVVSTVDGSLANVITVKGTLIVPGAGVAGSRLSVRSSPTGGFAYVLDQSGGKPQIESYPQQ